MRVAVSGRRADDAFILALRERIPATIELDLGDAGPAEILVRGTPTEADLNARPGLRAVVIPYAGVPRQTRELLATRPDLTLHNLHHNAAPTAEMAMALLLAAAKCVVPHDQALRRGDWSPRYEAPREMLLDGAHAVVIGHGEIGSRVARACGAIGMRVTAVRRTARGDEDMGTIAIDRLDEALPEADAVVLALPLTPATEGMLDARRLAALPDGCCIVNVGRGLLVDESALFAELASGRLRAGIDVWYRYPESKGDATATPPSEFDFGALDNVVLSPHRAGHCARIEELRAEHLARLLLAAADGRPMPNRVDLEAGY
ncbi:MAG: NAD(P)-dependent oxidoreductase [Planctomycetota bacterium]|jgi:phosphoglycerate dehydrogenase-like enzyme